MVEDDSDERPEIFDSHRTRSSVERAFFGRARVRSSAALRHHQKCQRWCQCCAASTVLDHTGDASAAFCDAGCN